MLPSPLQMQICFLTKRKKEIGKYTAKLTFLWYDNFGKKERSLHRKGMAAIQKRSFPISNVPGIQMQVFIKVMVFI